MEKVIIEIIGYVGMFFVVISFLAKKITLLRLLNCIGAFLSLLYGCLCFFLLKEAGLPTAILNFVLLGINIIMLIKEEKKKKKLLPDNDSNNDKIE